MKSALFSFSIAYFLFITCACSPKKSLLSAEEHVSAIEKVLKTQQQAWNNGDIPGFMKGYWNSEELTFVGSKGVTYSWAKTLSNYHSSYPDLDAMGILNFDIINVKILSDTDAYVLGKYTLTRKNDKPSGYFSLLWEKIDGKWLITSDHTSG